MATGTYKITFIPSFGVAGTLVEYKLVGDPTWIVPSSSPNPTINDYYNLPGLNLSLNYIVRLSSPGINCVNQYAYIGLPVPTTSTTTTTTPL